MQPGLLLDAILIVALLVTAGSALLSRDLFRAVVLFISFGLLMALAWVRLQAPDLALAEAAIGAGLAGALLLNAVGRLGDLALPSGRALSWIAGGLCAGFTVIVWWAIAASPEPSPRLARALGEAMPDSGVSHEITAVLLNFRGYDTFLEMAVLAVAAFAALALPPVEPASAAKQQVSNRLLDYLVMWLGPIMLMVAFYLLWAGSRQPGGALQAGAVLAAAGVLLRLAGVKLPLLAPGVRFRLGLIAGFAVFLVAALIGPLVSLPIFFYPAEFAGPIILCIETFLMFSIGLTFMSLFTAVPPAAHGHNHAGQTHHGHNVNPNHVNHHER